MPRQKIHIHSLTPFLIVPFPLPYRIAQINGFILYIVSIKTITNLINFFLRKFKTQLNIYHKNIVKNVTLVTLVTQPIKANLVTKVTLFQNTQVIVVTQVTRVTLVEILPIVSLLNLVKQNTQVPQITHVNRVNQVTLDTQVTLVTLSTLVTQVTLVVQVNLVTQITLVIPSHLRQPKKPK